MSSDEKLEANTLLHEDPTFQMGFTQVPNQVLYARNVSASAKTLYAILLSYAWREDRCFPGYARLRDHMALSERIVRKYMRELEGVGLLRQRRRGLGLTNVYTLLSLTAAKLEAERHMGVVQEQHRTGAAGRTTCDDKEDSSNSLRQQDAGNSNLRGGKAALTRRRGRERSPTAIRNATKDKVQRLANGYTVEEDVIARYIEDFSRELGDVEHTRSNVRQALNIYQRCREECENVDLDFYVAALQAASELVRKVPWITKRRENGMANRMPYYFKTIREYFGIPDGKTLPGKEKGS